MRGVIMGLLALLLAGCSPGEVTLHIDNESGVPVTVSAPRGNGKEESVSVPPLGSGKLYVSKAPETRITTKAGEKVVEEFEVGKLPELQTGVHDEALYLIQPAGLPYDLYTADYSGLYGEKATGQVGDVVKRTGTKFVKLSSSLSGIEVSLPSEVIPREVRQGKLLYRLVRVPKGVAADQVGPYMLSLLKKDQGRQ